MGTGTSSKGPLQSATSRINALRLNAIILAIKMGPGYEELNEDFAGYVIWKSEVKDPSQCVLRKP